MTIACIPTRGIIYSRTIDSVLSNQPDRVIFSHARPVPEAYNYLVEQALKAGADELWFIDDDMAFGSDTLTKLRAADTDVALMDYLVETGPTVQKKDGEFLFGGMGCVLAKAQVFEDIRFRTNVGYKYPDMTPFERQNPEKHGGQDVDFFQQLKQKGYTVAVCGRVDHLRSDVPHRKGNNTSYKVRKI